ncbi:PP2C family protein-serine/threonine phosphatase [Phaeacidiphilus oryzae]|uniref:PP2C family protein-serine/threonine phosphatase n=1 Tax=Phaeacidiphilus oryzae TaxID=348818 RepID=UPI00068D708F|nr:SpoIIE family protein phosphatase [Phaeacidiphilus oryzae]
MAGAEHAREAEPSPAYGGGTATPAHGGEESARSAVPASGGIPRPRGVPADGTAAAGRERPGGGGSGGAPLTLLVVEADPGTAALVKQLLAAAGTEVELRWARGVSEAAHSISRNTSCVLLDLELDRAPTQGSPETDPLDGLRRLLRRAPGTAVLVLTDTADAHLGAAAVAAGAQDFLVKQELDGHLLTRALRYAVERKRADESQRRLVESELRGQENARIQRHLLPTPLLDGAGLDFHTRYRPGRRRSLLGGDFYDAVRTGDGTVHVVIGDVCGHGPDEAALGVALRIAWRTLVFAGLTGEALLTTLQRVLEHERRSEEIFATLCMLAIHPGRETADLHLAGHPAPLLLRGADPVPELLPHEEGGPALGLLSGAGYWPGRTVRLGAADGPGEEWSLMLYTDGLIEGRIGAGSRRLGQEGLINLVGDHREAGLRDERLIDTALSEVEELNGGALADDVAVLLLTRG